VGGFRAELVNLDNKEAAVIGEALASSGVLRPGLGG